MRYRKSQDGFVILGPESTFTEPMNFWTEQSQPSLRPILAFHPEISSSSSTDSEETSFTTSSEKEIRSRTRSAGSSCNAPLVFPLLSLPPEILLVFIKRAPYHTLLALRQVSHIFASLITTNTLLAAHKRLTYQILHQEQSWSPFPDYLLDLTKPYRDLVAFTTTPIAQQAPPHANIPATSLLHFLPKHRQVSALHNPAPRNIPLSMHHHLHPPTIPSLAIICYRCLLPLPATHFSTRHITGPRRPHGPASQKRFCIDCALSSKRWQPGTKIRNGTRTRYYPPSQLDKRGVVLYRQEVLTTPFYGNLWANPETFNRMRVVCEICGDLQVYLHHWRKRCRETRLCAYCTGEYVDDETVPPMPGYIAELHTQRRQAERTVVRLTNLPGLKLLEMFGRKTRCNRCWAIDHTAAPANGGEFEGVPLCEACVNLALIGVLGVVIV